MKIAKRIIEKLNEAKEKAPKWYKKMEDAMADVADAEAMKSRVYRLTDGESDDLEGDKDIAVPYFIEERDLSKLTNTNNAFWGDVSKIKGGEDFVKKSWKMSYGESGGMMPHSDANIPSGSVVLVFEGNSDDEEFGVSLESLMYDKKIKGLLKKEKIGIADFARFFINCKDVSYMKPEYNLEDIDKAKKDKDIGEFELTGNVPADVIYGVYVNSKELLKFLTDAKTGATDWEERIESLEE